ncbi:LysE family transporter [Bacillus sp. FSL W8-0102]|jgi:threonine/homoserine/homoserine lactone efflux protein|uniref:LysE family transporter n=1 Tax=Bacillus sp. FSL W8-0102 TaxID=2978205 RepID=UPI0030F52519
MSVSLFVSYLLLGLSLAAPIGPINAAQLDKGIKSGFMHAWLVGVGALIADAFYMMLVYLGFVRFLDAPFIQAFLWLFGFFVLVYTGVESLLTAGKISTNVQRSSQPLFKTFISGFFMSLSNPLTILFWLGIYGSVLAKTATTYGKEQLFFLSGTIFAGIFLWDLTMAFIASSFRKLLSTNFLYLTSFLSGLSLVGFGFYFGFQGIMTLIAH